MGAARGGFFTISGGFGWGDRPGRAGSARGGPPGGAPSADPGPERGVVLLYPVWLGYPGLDDVPTIALAALSDLDQPLIQSFLTREVSPQEQGTLQGALAGLQSLTVALGGLLFSSVAKPEVAPWLLGLPFFVGALLYATAAINTARLFRALRVKGQRCDALSIGLGVAKQGDFQHIGCGQQFFQYDPRNLEHSQPTHTGSQEWSSPADGFQACGLVTRHIAHRQLTRAGKCRLTNPNGPMPVTGLLDAGAAFTPDSPGNPRPQKMLPKCASAMARAGLLMGLWATASRARRTCRGSYRASFVTGGPF